MARATLARCLAVLVATSPSLALRHGAVPRRAALRQGVGAGAALLVAPPAARAGGRSRSQGYEVVKEEAEWSAQLSEMQYFILRRGGTERPNSSPLVKEKRPGVFACAGCGAALFSSDAKFESGTGWPSFAAGLPAVEVESVNAAAALLAGAELRCARCGGHLGDKFLDGKLFPNTPAFKTGARFCIDGGALVFRPADGAPEVAGEAPAAPRRAPAEQELPSWLQPPPVGGGATSV